MKEVMEIGLAEDHGLPTDVLSIGSDTPAVVVATSAGYLLCYEVKDWTLRWATRVCEGSIRRVFACGEDLCLVAPTDGGLLLGRVSPGDGGCKMTAVRASKECPAVDEKDTTETPGPLALGVVNALAHHPGEDSLYVGTEEGDVHYCRLDPAVPWLKILHTYDHHDDYISDLYLAAGKRTILVASGDGSMSVVDLRKKSVVASTKNFGEDITAIVHVAGNKVVLGTSMGALREFTWNYWGAPSGSAKASLHGHASINKIVGVDDGSAVVTAADDGCLRLCSLEPLGSQVRVLVARKDDPIQGLAFLPTARPRGKRDTDREALGVLVFIVSTDASLFVVPLVGGDRGPPSKAKGKARHDCPSGDDEEGEETHTSRKQRKKVSQERDNRFPGLD